MNGACFGRAAATAAQLLVAFAAMSLAQEDGTARELLWSDPAADLPDVLLSESVKYVTEGSDFTYTVVLTHQPGMREDQTVDLDNDEVRIYLTSSQEVYQQTGPDPTDFSQVLGHRTQLEIDTNYVDDCPLSAGNSGKWTDSSCILGTCHATVVGQTYTDSQVSTLEALTTNAANECTGATPPGVWIPASVHTTNPIPYKYVPYSTVNPSQPSPIVNDGSADVYKILCPKCTHSLYCTHDVDGDDDVDSDDIIDGTSDVSAYTTSSIDSTTNTFDGCYDIKYKGFAPILDKISATKADASTASTAYVTQGLESIYSTIGVGLDGTTANTDLTTVTVNFAVALTSTAQPGSAVASFDGETGLITRSSMGPNVAGATIFTQTSTATTTASRRCTGGDCTGTQTATLAKSINPADGSTGGRIADQTADVTGNSNYRMEPDGFPVERDVTNPSAYCRYCARPGLVCDALLKDDLSIFTPGDPCNLLTKNGGDQQPGALGTGLANWKAYRAGASPNGLAATPRSRDFSDSDAVRGRGGSPTPTWRGDVSSAAQLVFNSNNWNKPQYVKVTAFEDDVYEPNVNGRGQDAYVHHFVVAQDENLQHTYYDDIDVNDLVVSITDNDHAVAVQELNTNNQLTPEEGHDVHGTQSSGCTTADVDEYNECTSSNWAQRGPDKLVLSLSSEPMYDVVIYVQSGPFFDGTPSASTILPDDEQVIFQDLGQFETCFAVAVGDNTASSNTGRLVTTCAYNGGAPAPSPIADVAGCDPHGSFIAAETFASAVAVVTEDTAASGGLASGATVGTLAAANSGIVPGMVVSIDVASVLTPQAKVKSVSGTTITFDRPITVADSTQMTFSYGSTADLPTQGFGTALGAYPNGLDLGDTCADLNVGSGNTPADTCNTYNSAGCSWDGSECAYSIPATGRKAMDLSCLFTTDETQCNAREGCIWYASIGSGTCLAETKGYDCNSYLVFTSTNWNVAQTLSVIAVDDDEDEVATLSPPIR